MQTSDISVKPLRIENEDSADFTFALRAVVVLSGIILIGMVLWDVFGKGVPFLEVLASFPRLALIVVLCVGLVVSVIRDGFGIPVGIPGSSVRPYWIEISDHLSYANRRGVKSLHWDAALFMHFEYTNIFEGDDPLPHDAYNTRLIITLATGQPLKVRVATVVPGATDCIDKIIQTQARALQAAEAKTRLEAIKGLSLLGRVCLERLRDTAKLGEHDCLRRDATAAISKLHEAVPLLRGVATNDADESVRTLANDTASRLHLNLKEVTSI